MASILSTTGELAKVAGSSLRPHIGDILPLVIDAVGQPNGAGKSVVAVITLGQASVTSLMPAAFVMPAAFLMLLVPTLACCMLNAC